MADDEFELDKITNDEPINNQEKLIEKLQEDLTQERDERREERFFFLMITLILLDVVFFSVMDNFGGPLSLLILQLLILIPLAKRMGMEEIAEIFNGVLNRLAANGKEEN